MADEGSRPVVTIEAEELADRIALAVESHVEKEIAKKEKGLLLWGYLIGGSGVIFVMLVSLAITEALGENQWWLWALNTVIYFAWFYIGQLVRKGLISWWKK